MINRVAELREQLELLKRDLHCADMIDNNARREREMKRVKAQIAAVESELAGEGKE